MSRRLDQGTRTVWAIIGIAAKKFMRIDGVQWAGAFAFNAFFSLFPLMIILTAIVSYFVARDIAGKEVIAIIESYVPINGEMQIYIFNVIAEVIQSREKATTFALIVLTWTTIQCFMTLIVATNRAWDTRLNNWWRLPLKSLTLLGITAGAILLSIVVPVLIRMAKGWLLPARDFHSWVYDLGSFVIPFVVVFIGLTLFYRFSPSRPMRFSEVWVSAICVAVLLRVAEYLFIIYLEDFSKLNAVYGTFGGIMALLLWIYVSGCVFIYGACLCATLNEIGALPVKTNVAPREKKNKTSKQQENT